MAYLSPQGNLVLQIAILAIIVASLLFKNKRKFFLHGSTMVVAVVLNLLSFILIMGPSLLNLREIVALQPQNTLSIVTITHAIFGTLASILGVWLAVSWRLQSSFKNCARRKKLMRVTLALWFVALFSALSSTRYGSDCCD